MDYERLSVSYRARQFGRIQESVRAIRARPSQSSPGTVVPQDGALTIGTGRQIKMAILFLDICSFSSRPSEDLHEQDLILRVFNLFFTEMIRIAEEYGGTVEKNTGDGLMAYFEGGAGSPTEGGTKRAVACALTMLDTTLTLINPIVVASGAIPLHFRVGIDYGPVTVAQVGAPKRFGSLVAIGTTANIASKMLAEAGPDEILIGRNAVLQLPVLWQSQFCALHTTNSGWFYRTTGVPYAFYKYVGRWTGPK